MEPALDDALEEIQLDVRTVIVYWGDDEPRANVTYHNCSCFEARGLAEAAVDRLKEVCRLAMDLPQEPDLDDDEDEDDY